MDSIFASQSCEEQRNILLAAVEQSGSSIVITNADGYIEYVNQKFTELTGYTLDEAKGRTPNILKSGKQPDSFYQHLWNTIKSGKVWRGEVINRKKNGDYIYEEVVISPVKDESGKIIRFMGVKDDITDRKRYESDLLQSEQKYKSIFENLQDVYFETDIEGTILEISPSVSQHSLYTPKELIGRRYSDFFPPKERRKEYYYQSKNNLKEYETIYQDKNGDLIYCSVVRNLIKDSFGNPVKIIGTIRDITEWKKAEIALRKSEEKYRTIFENIQDVYVEVDLKGKIIEISPSVEKFCQYARGEILGTYDTQYFTNTKDKEWLIENLFLSGQISDFEMFFRDKDGREIPCLVTSKLITDEGGNPIKTVDSIRSIAERKKVEKALLESEKKFRSIFESSLAAMFLLDKEGKYIAVNESYLKISGYQVCDFINKSVGSLIHIDDKEKVQNALHKALIGEINTFTDEVRIYHQTGKIICLILNANAYYDEQGNFEYVLATFVDITERKEAEQKLIENEEKLLELNATKNKFFSIIAHDLKNPFNAIYGFSDLLLMNYPKYDDEKKMYFINTIKNASQQAFALLENLLVWSRSQTGSMEFKPEKVELNDRIKENLSLVSPEATKKKINLISELTLSMSVFGDRNMIDTILRNLISNAVKFTNIEGQITVSVTELESLYQITVKDTGVGIDKENIEKLFKIDNKFTRKGTADEQGTGLGLILCREFVERNGGKIWVESEVGTGSQFIFTLPRII